MKAGTKKYEFTVRGFGHFPVDMLRYDTCYPRTTEDAILLTKNTLVDAREVTLLSYYAPTPARWETFGWTVTAEREYRIP